MILLALTLAWSQPLPRVGGCPLGYYTQATYCVPSPAGTAQPAIQREGSTCPLGYYKSANYCIKP